MKHLLLFLLCQGSLDGFGQVKKNTPIKPRYFFVGYSARHSHGNLMWTANDGKLPQKAELLRFYNKTFPADSVASNEYIITGLFEFKNKQEGEKFFNDFKQQ